MKNHLERLKCKGISKEGINGRMCMYVWEESRKIEQGLTSRPLMGLNIKE